MTKSVVTETNLAKLCFTHLLWWPQGPKKKKSSTEFKFGNLAPSDLQLQLSSMKKLLNRPDSISGMALTMGRNCKEIWAQTFKKGLSCPRDITRLKFV
jgi:hypothetical protein